MNLGRDTIDELFLAIEKDFTNAELQRLLIRYNLTGWQTETTTPKMIVKALPAVHTSINGTHEMSNLVQYVLTAINTKSNRPYDPNHPLAELYPELANTLLRGGYNTDSFQLTRTIPIELEAVRVPDELTENLNHFSLHNAIGHLEQAQLNYREGNWAAANAMVRSCYETVLIFINYNLHLKIQQLQVTMPSPN